MATFRIIHKELINISLVICLYVETRKKLFKSFFYKHKSIKVYLIPIFVWNVQFMCINLYYTLQSEIKQNKLKKRDVFKLYACA